VTPSPINDPPVRSIAGASVLVGVLTWAIFWAISLKIGLDSKSTRVGTLSGVLIVIVATIVSLKPMQLLMRRDASGIVSGWILGMVLRMPLCLASSVAVVKLLPLPANVVLGSMTVAYLLTLAAETALVLRSKR
jgi:hypothetical protein